MEYNEPMLSTKYGACTIDLNRHGIIVCADSGIAEMTGYSIDELTSADFGFRRLIIQEERADVYKYIKAKTPINGMTCLECFVACKNGNVVAVSCFAKSVGNGFIDVMLSENVANEEGSSKSYDSLTGFYCYDSAVEEIKRMLMCGKEKFHSCVLYKIVHIDRMEEEYGQVFASTTIENVAIYINHEYQEKGRKVIMARIRHDTFMVFQFATEPHKVEDVAKWCLKELNKRYYGRNEHIYGGIATGISHMAGDEDFDTVLRRAEMALAYSEHNHNETEVYSSEREYEEVDPRYADGYDETADERSYDYDNRFMAFAISLLENSKDEDSSLDMLIQRISWHFGLSRCIVGVFEGEHNVRITNIYKKGSGISTDEGPVYDTDDWGDIMRNIDSSGCLKIKDASSGEHFGKASEILKGLEIGSMISYRLYDKNVPIGFVSFGQSDVVDEWDENEVNTLMQLSKIVSLFLTKRSHSKNSEQMYDRLSRDELTGLYVYPAFIERVKRALYNYDQNKAYAMIYSDIDNFSYVNENFGYEAGDTILRSYASRIHGVRTSEGMVCHVHGDKFLTFSVRESKEAIERTVYEVNNDFYEMKRRKYPMSEMRITTGIYFIEDPEIDVINAISNAIHIWKSVKKDKYKTYGVYTKEFEEERQQRIDIIGSVHNSIDNGEIEAFLQPKFSMKTMEVVGAEALARWRNPDGSYKFPNQFIPILEEARFIIDVDFCIYEQVLKTLAKWKADGRNIIPISVNFSRQHMHYNEFTRRIKKLTKKYGVETKYIEIEITESAASDNVERLMEFMRELREDGYKVDIDDFGTGYSALNMLLDVPVDIVKVDKSIIDSYASPSEREYIDRVGKLIRTAKKDIIFEGVETRAQLEFLVSCGYENAQGYIFSKPIPISEFEEKYIYAD